SGVAGDSAFFFDNNDNGAVDVGENIIFLNHGGAGQDSYAINAAFSNTADTAGGGTNDVTAAETNPGEVTTVEYRFPLCSADTARLLLQRPSHADASRAPARRQRGGPERVPHARRLRRRDHTHRAPHEP